MISMTSIKSAGGSAKYMTEQAAVEYYANEQAPSQWKGQGAEIQGLAGRDVTTSELTQQLEGKVHEFSKETGEWEEKELGRWKVPKTKDGEVGKYEVGTEVKFGHYGSASNGVTVEDSKIGRNQEGTVVSMKDNIVTVKLDDGRLATVDVDQYKELQAWEHRAGWDLTFAAPKSVSIESEVFGNTDARDAHEYGVMKAMEFLQEKAAQCRVGKDSDFVKTGNLTFATFEHATSRAGDCQTHTHVLVMNSTFIDGVAYSLSNEKLLDYRATADSIYKMESANYLHSKGLQTEFDKNGSFELAGYTKDQLDVFSKRTEQIKDALAERGMDKDTASHSARQAATLDTRQDKNHPESALAHRDKWQQEAEAAGIKPSECQQQPAQLSHGEQMQAAREAVQSAINHLSEREQAFTDRDLWKESAKLAQGQTDTDKIASAIGELQKKGELIERDDGKFTTKEAVDAEKFMAEHLSQGQGAHEFVLTNKEFDAALIKFETRKEQEIVNSFESKISTARESGDFEAAVKIANKLEEFKKEGFHLTSEQRDASRMILTGDDRFQGVQGLAGTGKTTMLEFVREAAESKGWEIKGFSNGGAQADKMQAESHIQCSTTAKHLIESDKVAKSAELAQKAIDTYEKNSGVFGQKPDWNALDKQVKSGEATKSYDMGGGVYFTDKNDNTWYRGAYDIETGQWSPGLYNKVTEIESKNFEHVGLTATQYAVTEQGVFKSGGNLISEAAGALKDAYNESLAGKAKDIDWAVNKILSKGEQWEKCNIAESTIVRGLCESETSKQLDNVLGELKDQSTWADGTQTKTLYICDEASMSGQREFNRVIESTEQAGARAVFLGDEMQHQAVEAGKGFELAQDHMTMSNLEMISRQKTDYTKDAVSTILKGEHAHAIESLPTKEITTHQDAVREKYEGRDDLKTYEKAAMRSELKEAGLADNKDVIRELAKDYTSMDREDRDKTLVITSTNQDRTSINTEIRENLKEQGELQNGKSMDTLEKTGLTKEEASRAINYEKGQVVEFGSDYKSVGVEKGDQITVTHSDNRTNMVFGKTDDGREVGFNPEKIQNKELYEKVEGKEFAVGDRVTFTKNDSNLDVKNGQIGTVEKFDGKDMTIKMESGEKREFDVKEYQHIDHAYAMTSHKSQGQTYDNVMIHHNTDAGQHGDRETYVNVTRAREDVTVYTQDAEKAAKQSGFEMDKESATTKESDREVRAERPVERETEQQSAQPAMSKEYEQAVQAAEQHLPEFVAKASPEQIAEKELVSHSKEQELGQALGVADAIKTSDEFYKNADERMYAETIKSVERAIDDRQSTQPEQQPSSSTEQASEPAKASEAVQSAEHGGKDVGADRGSEPQQSKEAEPTKEREPVSEQHAETVKDQPTAEVVSGQEKTHDDRQSPQPEQQQSASTEQVSEPAKASETVSERGDKDVGTDRGAEPQQATKDVEPAKDQPATEAATASQEKGERVAESSQPNDQGQVRETARPEASSKDAVSASTQEADKEQPASEAVATQDKGQERSPETVQSNSQEQGREPISPAQGNDYEQAVQKAEQSLPDVKSDRATDIDHQSSHVKERELGQALGVADAIKTSDEFFKNADQHVNGMTDKERQLSEALDVAGNIQTSDNHFKNADERLYEETIKSVERSIDDRQSTQPEHQQSASTEQVSELAKASEVVSERGDKDVGSDRGAEPQQASKDVEPAKDQPATEAAAASQDKVERVAEASQSNDQGQVRETAQPEASSKDAVSATTQETVKEQPASEAVATQDKGQERSPETVQSADQGQGREPVQSTQAEASVAAKPGSDVSIEKSEYAEQRLDQWLKEISGVSEKSSSADKSQVKEADQSRDGATAQISGTVEGKGRGGESSKEKDVDPKDKSKAEGKESKDKDGGKSKESSSRREREWDMGR